MTAAPSLDDLAAVLRSSAETEARMLIQQLQPTDLTPCELVAMSLILREALERKRSLQMAPASLKLVQKSRRARR